MNDAPVTPRFAIGDIHGCFDALQSLIELVPLEPDDVFVTLGDYVNKGPDTRLVIDWLIDQTQAGSCIPLCGNHDKMLQEAVKGNLSYDHWFHFGGKETIQSYMGHSDPVAVSENDLNVIPQQHRHFFVNSLLPYYETDRHIFVHGSVQPDLDLAQQPEYELYWTKFEFLAPHKSGKKVICGHTAQKSGWPLNRCHATCIDTAVYKPQGWLTCLEIESGQYWQANQQGATRTDWLPSPEI